MKLHPILFSGDMVRALLEGRKTQTRRVVTVPWHKGKRTLPYDPAYNWDYGKLTFCDEYGDYHPMEEAAPWKIGDRLWVRETWVYRCAVWSSLQPDFERYRIEYVADGSHVTWGYPKGEAKPPKMRERTEEEQEEASKYGYSESYQDYMAKFYRVHRPSIFLPRCFSRSTLEVEDIRCQRLQDITDEDAKAEGTREPRGMTQYEGKWVNHFRDFIWNELNGDKPGRDWDSNPWVWAITFKQVPTGDAA